MSDGEPSRWASIVASLRSKPDADFVTVMRAGRALCNLIAAGSIPDGIRRSRIFVLRSMTIEVLVPVIVAECAVRDIAVTIDLGEIGNFGAEVADPQSRAYVGGFDAAILWADADAVLPSMRRSMIPREGEREVQEFLDLVARLAKAFAGAVLVSTLAMPGVSLAPHFQANQSHSPRYLVEAANRSLAALTEQHTNLVIWDLDHVERNLGGESFWSPRDAATAMQPYSSPAILRIARSFAEVFAMTRRPPAKVVVVDCDNTLWGGVVGEDGINGIALGETYPGTMFERLQWQLRQLAEIGFLLAVNSKNNEADVREVFDTHPRSVLRWSEFSAARVNWQDKAANLVEIAQELNVGVDSIVFLDDNEFELEHVRSAIPGVTALRITEKCYDIPAVLAKHSRLDCLRLTAEDRKKAEQYAQEKERAALREAIGSYEEYLQSLHMVLSVERFNGPVNGQRAAQLTQKTNQFNLTTRRYTQAELEQVVRHGARILLAALKDRVGDYGRIALAIITVQGTVAELDTFLMSCRAIGRGVEARFLGHVIEELRSEGIRELRARYMPTARNAMCAEFLAHNGFQLVQEAADGSRQYRFPITPAAGPVESPIHLEVSRA